MKKKLLALVAFLLTATAINAQVLKVEGKNLLKKAPSTVLALPNMAKQSVQKANLAENQRILGYYTGDERGTKDYGLGLKTNATLKAGVMFTPDLIDNLVGGQMVKARFAVWLNLGNTTVEVFEVDPKGAIATTASAKGTVSAIADTWNEVTLDNPVTLKENYSYIVCYTYKQVSGQYPLAVDGEVNPGGEDPNGYGSMLYGNLGDGEGWSLSPTGYGNFLIQGIVEGGTFLNEDIALKQLSTTTMVKKGTQLSYSFNIKNSGLNAATSYTLKLSVDGNELETLTTPIVLTDSYQTVNGNVTVPADLVSGQHTFSVEVTTINGNVPTEGTGNDKLEASFVCYAQDVPRQLTLIENFTSQQCVYCPYGHDVLEALTSLRPDLAWVGVHASGMGNDSYVTDETDAVANFQATSYPTASFNRMYINNTQINDQGTLAIGIGYQPTYAQAAAEMLSGVIDELNASIPAFATVAIQSTLNGKDLNIKVYGDAVEEFKNYVGDDAVVTVYLLEDGLVASQKSATGTVSNFVHNNVLRDVVTNNVYGDAINWTGATTYQNEFNVTLDDSWKAKNMRVVAFIGRPVTETSTIDDVWVNNTNMVKVGETTAIEGPATSDDANVKEVARYTVDGRKLNSPVKGLNIIKMSDGRTIKVTVK